MSRKILNVLTQSHRATIDEQDDPVLWLNAVLKSKGTDVSLLLRGAAIGSAVRGQDASGLSFGEKRQTQPARLEDDIARFIAKGVSVRYVKEEAETRGYAPEELVAGVEAISREELPGYYRTFDQVWGW